MLFNILLLTFSVSAQIKYYKTSEMYVAPGVMHQKYWQPKLPWTLNVLIVDLMNPYITVESLLAGDVLGASEKTSSQILNKSYEGHEAVGGINADFYGGSRGIPISTQIRNGEIVITEDVFTPAHLSRSTFSINKNNKPAITNNRINSYLIKNDFNLKIDDVNKILGDNQLMLYNNFNGSNTLSQENSTEILIDNITDWIVNDTTYCVVQAIYPNQGKNIIPNGKAILSASGTKSLDILNNIIIGDTIKLFMNLDNALPKITQMVGGFPRIVKDGVNYANAGYYEEGGGSTFHTDYHPRTAAGFNTDSTKIYFITIDGRQSSSRGMSLMELADFMIFIGVHEGVNLDGGGSTTMFVRGEIKNSPSDGSERAVKNALGIYTSAPKDELASINIEPKYMRVFKGSNLNFKVYGWDNFYNPVNINQAEINFSITPELGTIEQSGLFTAANAADTGYVYVFYNNLIDSCLVIIKDIDSIKLKPANVLTDSTKNILLSAVGFDEDKINYKINNEEIFWSVTNPKVGFVDSSGVFHGMNDGETFIIGKINDASDTIKITVLNSFGERKLNSFDNLENWNFIGENLNMNNSYISIDSSIFYEGNNSLKIDFEYTGDNQKINFIHLKTDIILEGTPDSIMLYAITDGNKNQFRFYVQNADSELFQVPVKKWADNNTQFDIQPADFTNATPVISGSYFKYPLTLKEIEIKLGGPRVNGQIYSATFYIDNLKVKYQNIPTSVSLNEIINDEYKLFQNYPNPFNPETIIEFYIKESANISLKIFDSIGREITTLFEGRINSGYHKIPFNAESSNIKLSSGVYFYQLKSSKFLETKKLILLK